MHLSASQESQISHRFFFSASSAPLCVKSLSLFHSFTLSLFSSTVPKQNHIPLLHHIFLPLQSHLRLLPRCPQASRRQQIIPPHHFRAYEAFLNVAVNRPRRLHRHRPLANRPRAHFRLTRREKLDQSQ